jgi:hypothetical protein
MRPWDDLDEDLKTSNLDQIAYMAQILRANGYDVEPAVGSPVAPQFTREEIDAMARMEHGRWNLERIRSDWHYDTVRDPGKRLSPYLAAWEQLSEDVRDWDRRAVQRFPQLLAEAGLQIVRRNTRP